MNQSCVQLDGLKTWALELDRSMHWKAEDHILEQPRLSFARKTPTSSPATTSIISIYRGLEIGLMNSVKEAVGDADAFGWGRVEQSEQELKRTRTGLLPRRQRTVPGIWLVEALLMRGGKLMTN